VRRPRTVLLIEPDEVNATSCVDVFRAAGAECRVARDAEVAWRWFAEAPPDVVLTALATPRRDATWLLRRMRDEYLGSLPPVYAMASDPELTPATRALELDAVLVKPVAAEALVAMVTPPPQDPPVRHAGRLRDLFDLTLLGDDIQAIVKVFVDRVALAFRASDCVLWGPAHEDLWPRTRRPLGTAEEQAFLLWRCDLALTAGATVIVSDGTAARSFLAAPLDAPGARSLGALCLVDDGARRFTAEEREALAGVARRVARELAWRSAHDRLVAEHGRLRETSLVDPLLGVWTRAALEESMAAEVGRAQRSGEPVAVAVLDVEQLRQINDRHGHLAGDAVLGHVAHVVRSNLRPQDLVGRVAGDELGIVLPGVDANDALALLEGVRKTLGAHPVRQHGLEIEVRVRVGVTSVAPGEHGDGPLTRALAALGHAKRARVHVHVVPPGPLSPSNITGSHSIVDEHVLPDLLPAGTTLGGMYQVLHEISRGAMGVVYRAEDLGLRRPVAVKVLRADLARDADLVARFREEAAMLAALHHENLVQVFAFGAQGDDVYFVMELVEGEALSDLMGRVDEEGEPIGVELVGAVIQQVAGALAAMHKAGAVHRDVKPANVLLDRVRDRAVLVDVGVAKRRGAANDAAGTPGFAAPESFTTGDEGPATDVYGLAATTYMMLTGLAPFGGGDVAKVVRRQLADKPAAPSSLRAELSLFVDKVVLRALSPNPRDRYPGALEFAYALGAALQEPPEPGRLAAEAQAAVNARIAELRAQRAAQGDASTTTRRLLQSLEIERPAPAPAPQPATRGALFRVAYKILGNRLGSAWIRNACEQDPGLAEVLRPNLAPFGWYPVARLVSVLSAVPAGVRDPRKVARELGRASMTATFARFFGADPSSLTPEEVLGAAGDFWGRYHSWGEVAVTRDAARVVVTVTGTPREPLLCCLVEGSLERIAELAGGAQARAHHPACETQGAAACTFEVRWQPATRAAQG
jgi:diguanylate cyclase (GGDEF)-like protein